MRVTRTTAGSSSRPLSFLPRRLLVALVLTGAASAAHAGSFMANPVRLTLAAGATSTSVLLENTGEEMVLVQAEVMGWSQVDGKDVLTPTDELVVSPPIFKVAPKASQTVRVGLLRPSAGEREIAYRVFLQEVAQPPPPGQQGISMTLRLGLPLFVLPKVAVPPQLAWRARAARGEITLTLTNSGNVHVQPIDCTLAREDGTVIAQQQLVAYVLAGQSRSWQIKPKEPWRGGKLKLAVRMSGGDVTAEITPE